MYGLMSTVSVLVRQFYLPNPFEYMGAVSFFCNAIAGMLLVPVAYALVGTIYRRGSFPALGSFLFLVVYAGLNGLLCFWGMFEFAWWAIAGTLAAFAVVVVLFERIRGDLY